MDHKRIAFDLLKTVVSAQDEGRDLPARIDTTWALLRSELPPAHRVISDEVSWRRDQQSDLKFVIDALAARFEAEPALAREVGALLELERAAASDPDPDPGRGESGKRMAGDRVGEADRLEAVPPEVPTQPSAAGDVPAVASAVPPPADAMGVVGASAHPPATSSPAPPELRLGQEIAPRPTAPRPKPAAISPKARTRLVAAVLTVAGALLVAAIYVRWAAGPASVIAASSSVVNLPADQRARQTTPVRERLPVRRAAPRSVGDEARAAREAQLLEVERLEAAAAPAEQRSEAYATLASLSADRGLYREAVEAQRVGLELAYDADADDRLRLSRNHLALARYYDHTGQSVIARAHLRQARHLAGGLGGSPQAAAIADEARRLERAGAGGE